MNDQRLIRRVAVIGGILGLWALIHLVTLDRYPPITCDETYYGVSGERFLNTLLGHGDARIADWVRLMAYGRFNLLGLTLTQRLLNPTLFGVRVWSLLGWVATLASTYWSGIQLFNQRVARWATVLTGTAWIVMFAGHVARPNIWLAASATLTVGLLKRAMTEESRTSWFLLGVFSTIAADIHVHALHFWLATWLLAGVFVIRHRRWQSIPWLLAGTVLAGGYVVAAHLLPGIPYNLNRFLTGELSLLSPFTAWLEIGAGSGGSAQTGGGGLLQVIDPLGSLADLPRYLWKGYVAGTNYETLPQAVLFLFGIVSVAPSRNSNQVLLGGYLAISVISFGILGGTNRFLTYAVFWAPGLFLLSCAGLSWLDGITARRGYMDRWGRVSASTLVVGGLVAIYVAGTLHLFIPRFSNSYREFLRPVNEALEDETVIVASTEWYYGLESSAVLVDEVSLLTSEGISYASGDYEPRPQDQDRARLQELRPDFLLLDGEAGCSRHDNATTATLELVAETECERIAILESPYYRSSRLYQCP